jgi:hypothetical protein
MDMVLAALLVGIMAYLATGSDDSKSRWNVTDLTEEYNR